MSMEMLGMQQLLNQLGTAGGPELEAAKQRALDKGAEYLRGKIADNTRRSKLEKEHAADNVVIEQIDDQLYIGYAQDFFYMMFDEFGTSKQSANPVVQRTFEQEIQATQNIMMAELRKVLPL